ncbi:MAG: ATP-binding protein, partial [bacterium]
FHRQGSSKRRLAPDALARLFQQRSQARVIRFDEQAVPETNARSLEQDLYERLLGTGRDRPTETLRKLCLTTGDEDGNERATVAGVLMATRSPERWLAGAAIQAVRYRGNRPDSNYQLDAQLITGALDEQIRLALAFARRNSSVAASKRPGRVDRPQYSDRALFEAIVNAVAHRDYSIHGSKIRLFLFDDRLELYSPGPFPNTVTAENLALRQSTRNELLTTLLSRCTVGDRDTESGRQYFMEKRGEGVPVIMEESRKLSGRVPTYRVVDDAEVQLTIYQARESNDDS